MLALWQNRLSCALQLCLLTKEELRMLLDRQYICTQLVPCMKHVGSHA
jgi:hypothetical protein